MYAEHCGREQAPVFKTPVRTVQSSISQKAEATLSNESDQLSHQHEITANLLSDPFAGGRFLYRVPWPIEVGLRLSDNVPSKRQALQGQSQQSTEYIVDYLASRLGRDKGRASEVRRLLKRLRIKDRSGLDKMTLAYYLGRYLLFILGLYSVSLYIPMHPY